MGPPIATVLTKLMNEQKIVSVDTTSHRVDIKHAKYVNKQVEPKELKILTKLMNEQKIVSVDTTSHRVDIKHARYVNKNVEAKELTLMTLLSLRKYKK